MAKVDPGIDGDLSAWLPAQPVVLLATAPLDADGLLRVEAVAGTEPVRGARG